MPGLFQFGACEAGIEARLLIVQQCQRLAGLDHVAFFHQHLLHHAFPQRFQVQYATFDVDASLGDGDVRRCGDRFARGGLGQRCPGAERP
ncbi:hypothetical protein GALL_363730 [mine drainage metagenome]|uniref:Uncharacterized protein n=1 Tax=mine drainage metagenome TaxID=410659 RepID=A0A1J5QPJ8_9ZZZZ